MTNASRIPAADWCPCLECRTAIPIHPATDDFTYIRCDGCGRREITGILRKRRDDLNGVVPEWKPFDNGGWEGADDDDPRYLSDPNF